MNRDDLLRPLRLWARGFWSGYASASSSEAGAAKAEAKLLLACRKLGWTVETVAMVLDEAEHTVRSYCPEPRDPYFIRWMGAELASATLLDLCRR